MPPADSADEQHAAGDAAVEHQRQRDVAAGAPLLADQLDDDRAERRDDDRGEHRGGAEQEAQRDAGQRDVADAVAHERQPPLHEEDADGGRGEPDEQRRQQRPLHEVERQRAHRSPQAGERRRRVRSCTGWACSGSCRCRWSGSGGGAVVQHPAVGHASRRA